MIGWPHHIRGSHHSPMVTRWVTYISLVGTGGLLCVKNGIGNWGHKYTSFLAGEGPWDLGAFVLLSWLGKHIVH